MRTSVGVGQRGTDLVGEQDGHSALLDRRADDSGRGCEKELPVNDVALPDDQSDRLISW